MAEAETRREQRGSWRAGDDASALFPFCNAGGGRIPSSTAAVRFTDRRFASHRIAQYRSPAICELSFPPLFTFVYLLPARRGFIFSLALFSAVFESASLRIEELISEHPTHGVVVHSQCARAQGHGVMIWVSLVIIIARCENFGGLACVRSVHLWRVDWNWRLRIAWRKSVRSSLDKVCFGNSVVVRAFASLVRRNGRKLRKQLSFGSSYVRRFCFEACFELPRVCLLREGLSSLKCHKFRGGEAWILAFRKSALLCAVREDFCLLCFRGDDCSCRRIFFEVIPLSAAMIVFISRLLHCLRELYAVSSYLWAPTSSIGWPQVWSDMRWQVAIKCLSLKLKLNADLLAPAYLRETRTAHLTPLVRIGSKLGIVEGDGWVSSAIKVSHLFRRFWQKLVIPFVVRGPRWFDVGVFLSSILCQERTTGGIRKL